MPPDRFLRDTVAGEAPTSDHLQELVEAEAGRGSQGINRRWLASDSAAVVLTSTTAGVRISPDNGATAPANVIVQGSPAGGSLSGTYPNPGLSTATLDLLCPPGTIVAYGGASAPVGWLLCDGVVRAVSAFPRLAAVLGGTYGGDGTTTFAVPNLVGRVIVGTSGTHPRGQVAGAEVTAGPAHSHPGSHGHAVNGHTHGLNNHTHAPGTHTHDLNAHTHGLSDHAHTMASHSHQVDLDHDHPAASGAAAASASTLNGRFTAGGANALPDTHTHPVSLDLPGLGGTAKTSDGPSPSNTSTLTGAATLGTPAGAVTQGPSAASTGGNTGDTSSTTGATATDSTAHGAAYSESIAVMQPFAVTQYIIRTG